MNKGVSFNNPMGSLKPKTNQLKWYKKVFFSLLPLFLILSITEITFRILYNPDRTARTRSGFVIPDPDLIWRLKPRTQGALATNELGFRDLPYNKDADYKILLLGDSVSWGDSIRDTRAVYPQQLEYILNSKYAPKTFEVINSGVPGYSTFQELHYLQKKGLHLKPQLIILQFCLNDVVERYSALAQYGGENVFLGVDTRQSISGISGWLVRKSIAAEYTMKLLQKKARNNQELNVKQMARDKIDPDMKKAWDLVLSEIEGIRKTASQNNIPLLLVIAPYNFQLTKPNKLNQPQKILLEYAKKQNIETIDLLPYFVQYKNKFSNSILFHDANHFSLTGHQLAARILNLPVSAKLERIMKNENQQIKNPAKQ